MRCQSVIAVLLASVLVGSATTGFAQGKGSGQGKGGAQGSAQSQQANRDYDRDQQRQIDQLEARARKLDRDQLQMPDYSAIRDRDIYGHEVMSTQERDEYRERIQNAQSDEAREQLRAQNQTEVQARAKARGIDLTPASEGPIYGGDKMSMREKNEYREQLRMIESDEDRGKFVAEHREKMQAKAK